MKICVLVLAAGQSERMGSLKPLLPFNAKENFIQHIVGEITKAGIDDIVVVLGNRSEQIIPYIPDNAHFVINNDYELGQISSIKRGISYLLEQKADFRGAILTLSDHPFIKSSTFRQMKSETLDRDEFSIAKYRGIKGHPIYLPQKYWQDILAAPSSIGLKFAINKKSVFFIDTKDNGTIIDIDTPELYKKWFGVNVDATDTGNAD